MRTTLLLSKCSAIIIVAVLLSFVQSQAITITPKVRLNHPVIQADKAEVVYLLVQFDSPEIFIDKNMYKPDFNLGLVIDRSGSMNDKGKMTYAKKAAQYAVDQMLPSDRLAVVEYDEHISVLWPSTPVETPELIKSRIAELSPRGSTNLTGGMMKGVDEVLSSIAHEGINRVLLLSDGLANKGITDSREIKKLVRNARKRGVTISTMGLGLDYDEDLMQMIAEYGGGNYYYIEDPKQMRNIYQQELGTLYATICKNMKAVFNFTEVVTDCQIYGYVNEKDQNRVSIDIGNIYSGEKLSLVIRLEVNPEREGNLDIGAIDFDYFDVADNKDKRYTSNISVLATLDKDEVALAENKDVTVEAILVEADDYHDKQIKLFEAGRTEEAKKNIQTYAFSIKSMNSSLGDVQLEKKIEALEMETDRIQLAEKDDSFKSSYLKSNKARFYKSKKGKRGMYIQQIGDTGVEVKRLQEALKDKGYYSGSIDGNYNDEIKIAVKKFQKDSKLKADGIAGPKTLQLLGIY